jgi:curved DNA-binding protein CbpA
MTDAADPYKTLQVDPEAEDEVIAAAYRRLARKYHPDAAGPDGAARMATINAAWERIGDPGRRAAYDREQAVAAAMARAGTSAGARAGASPAPPSSGSPAASRPPASTPRPPESVSRDWTSGRSTVGSTYDPSMRTADGEGAAGPPPGNPSGSVLTFGRYTRWSLGEIARADLEYLEWLDRMPIGRPYRDEIDVLLRRAGRRRSSAAEADERRGLFRRR